MLDWGGSPVTIVCMAIFDAVRAKAREVAGDRAFSTALKGVAFASLAVFAYPVSADVSVIMFLFGIVLTFRFAWRFAAASALMALFTVGMLITMLLTGTLERVTVLPLVELIFFGSVPLALVWVVRAAVLEKSRKRDLLAGAPATTPDGPPNAQKAPAAVSLPLPRVLSLAVGLAVLLAPVSFAFVIGAEDLVAMIAPITVGLTVLYLSGYVARSRRRDPEALKVQRKNAGEYMRRVRGESGQM